MISSSYIYIDTYILTIFLENSINEMDRLVNLIACGVGSVKRKKRKPVRLVRLSLNRQSDAALSSDSDSSDEDYLPETKYVNFFEKIYICNNFYVCLLVFFFH